MSPQRFSSFIAFYSCTLPKASSVHRSFSTYQFRCLQRHRPDLHTRASNTFKRALHASAPLSASVQNPYQVLGVAKDAPQAEIKKVYFSLARKFHPDTNPDKSARDKFVEIQEAYDILKDEKKRALYDKYGPASQQPGFDPDAFANARGPFGATGGGFHDFSNIFGAGAGRAQGDLFEQLFGAFGGRGRGPGFAESTRGADLEASVTVNFLEACKGTTRNINVSPVVNCKACSGSGLRPGAKRSTCGDCGGSGTRTYVIDSGFQMASTCGRCAGTGTTIPRGGQCGECGGVGKVRTRKTVQVNIPPGVEDGMTIRVPNAGDASISGKGNTGDLLVRVNVTASKTFRRQGVNLHYEARIPLHVALLGGKVRVPTLDGDVDVRVPGGTQQGEEMVLRGRGIPPVFGGDKGDLFVSFSVQLPRSLTNRQREILQKYADDVEGRTHTHTSSKEETSQYSAERSTGTVNTENGTASSHQPSASGGWTGALQRLRKLIGI